MIWSICCMGFNFWRGVIQIISHYFVHVTDNYEYQTALQGKKMKEGQGIASFIQQLFTTCSLLLLNLVCWSSASEDFNQAMVRWHLSAGLLFQYTPLVI